VSICILRDLGAGIVWRDFIAHNRLCEPPERLSLSLNPVSVAAAPTMASPKLGMLMQRLG